MENEQKVENEIKKARPIENLWFAFLIIIIVIVSVVLYMNFNTKETEFKLIPDLKICQQITDLNLTLNPKLTQYLETGQTVCVYDNNIDPYIPTNNPNELQTNPDYKVCYKLYSIYNGEAILDGKTC